MPHRCKNYYIYYLIKSRFTGGTPPILRPPEQGLLFLTERFDYHLDQWHSPYFLLIFSIRKNLCKKGQIL